MHKELLIPLMKATIALFIIIDPIGLVPIFMALTRNETPESRRQIFARATWVAMALLVVLTFTGDGLLTLFGITLDDFKIAGGILLLVIALQIVNSGHWGADDIGTSTGVVPIATPLLVGPGAITTTIVFIRQYGVWITFTAVVITFLLTALIYRFVGLLFRVLRQSGSDVIAKIMGMLLAAIAVQFVREGIQASFFK